MNFNDTLLNILFCQFAQHFFLGFIWSLIIKSILYKLKYRQELYLEASFEKKFF